jgi:hypothetical protein
MQAQEKRRGEGLSHKEIARFKRFKVGYTSQCCAICLGQLEKGEVIRQLPCRHIFHSKACLDPWLASNPVCPVCRCHLRSLDHT